ncbi:hypothetical protein RND81_12G183900 [Saponaria officinalis]|uniref:Uncharacterized protein n=1 Tax=Saponaria officinalis TaxID=3572 RepID=A0AAW1HCH3_SAPOF
MRSPREVHAEHDIPPVRQRRHPRTREEARATQQAYNAQHQHQHQQEVVVPQQWYQDPEPNFPQYQVQQGGFMGLEGLDLDDLNWEQIQNSISDVGGLGGAPGDSAEGSGARVYGGVGGSGDGGSAAGVYNWGGYDGGMTDTTYPSGGGYDVGMTGTTYPSGGGYDRGMTGTTYPSGGGYDRGMTGTTYPSGGGYDGGMTGTTYGCGVGIDGDGLDLSLSLRPSDQSAVVDASQSVYRTPEQELRRLTRPVGRRDSNQHVRPTQGIGFGTRPRRIFTPEPDDEDE